MPILDNGTCEYIAGCRNPLQQQLTITLMRITMTEVVTFCFAEDPLTVVPQDQAIYGCMDAAAQSTYNPNATK